MTITGLLIIAFGGAFAVIWLIQYIPLYSKILHRPYSPRLLACRILAPFDAVFTLLLVCGGWVGLSTSVTGISMMVYNVLTGIGLSVGVLLVKKFFVPRWEKKFEELKVKKGEEYI